MQIHHAVEEIYRRDPGAFDETEHLVAALSDYVDTDGAGSGEIRLIVDAVKLGAFHRLRDLAEVGASPHAAIAETGAALARRRATDEDRSTWACAVLAFAIGLVNEADVHVYRAKWELPTALPPHPQQAATQPPQTALPPPTLASGPAPVPEAPVPQQPSYAQPPLWSAPPQSYPVGPQPGVAYAGTTSRRGAGWIVAVVAAVVLLTGGVVTLLVVAPWDDGGVTDPPKTDPPEVATPEVGACHALSTADLSANSDSKPPVDCDDGTATTITTDVVTLPDDVDRSSTDAVWEAIGPECAATTLSFLGGNAEAFARSAYTIAFFVPTAEEARAGADWARCDLSLLAGGGTKPLPEVEGSIDQLPLADEVALCAEDLSSGSLFTTCDLPHAYRATTSVYHAGKRPTTDELTTLGEDNCDDGSGSYAFAHVPDQTYWDAGATYLICFTFD